MEQVEFVEIDLGQGVRAGFTARAGGVSRGAWAGLDLALHVGDDPAHVARNRELLHDRVGAPVHFPRQVHGTGVVVVRPPVSGPRTGPPGPGRPPEPEDGCDALVAVGVGMAVGVLVADCVPLLLADASAGVVCAVHAGRRGLLDGVIEAALASMQAEGAQPSRIRAAIGPSAGPCCYEVPAAMREEAAAVLPGTWATTRHRTPALDLPGGCRDVLARAGVPDPLVLGTCTIEDDRYYSYRRAPVTGRFAGVVMMVA